MRIGELAERAGVSQRTIHYYERLGLLQPTHREGAGYRYYDELVLRRLQKIGALQRLGLSLEQIGQVIDLYFEDATGIRGKRKVLEILREQREQALSQIDQLRTFVDELDGHIRRIEGYIAAAGAE